MVHLAPPATPKGTKSDKVYTPGIKLKFENNKKALVALAAHPYDRDTLFLVTEENNLLVCVVQGASIASIASLSITLSAKTEKVQLKAMAHPQIVGATLISIEGSSSGVTIVEMLPRRAPRVVGTLGFGPGAVMCGVGLARGGSLLVAAARQASGNVQLQAWRLLCAGGISMNLVGGAGGPPSSTSIASTNSELNVVQTNPTPNTVMDVLAPAGSSGMVSGEAVVGWIDIHGPTGLIVAGSAVRGREGEAAHARLPLMQLLDAEDVVRGLGASRSLPLHTGMTFWTNNESHNNYMLNNISSGTTSGPPSTTASTPMPPHPQVGTFPFQSVGKLRFPRYCHVLGPNKVSAVDISHGIVTNGLSVSQMNDKGQYRSLHRVARSPKRAVWAAFMRVLSKGTGAAAAASQQQASSDPKKQKQAPIVKQPLAPGAYEFTLASDNDAEIGPTHWTLPARDGAFIGPNDGLFVALSNSGRVVAIFETDKLESVDSASTVPAPMYCGECKEGLLVAVHPGPPAVIPAPPLSKPEPPADCYIGDGDDGGGGGGGPQTPMPLSPTSSDQTIKKKSKDTEGREDGEDEDEVDAELQQYLGAMREWQASEERRLAPPKLMVGLTVGNRVCLYNVTQASGGAGGTGYYGSLASSQQNSTTNLKVLQARSSIQLFSTEAVVQMAWQRLTDPSQEFNTSTPGAGNAAASALAILTTERVIILSERLAVLATGPLPGDAGPPVSCLWVGPALLVSTAGGQVLHVGWDGRVHHACSLLSGVASPVTLTGALADRLLLASTINLAPGGAGSMVGLGSGQWRAEVSSRAFSPLLPMVEAWTSLAPRGWLPGGRVRIGRELRTLVGSYDASQLPVQLLEQIATAGFPEIAAAVARNSESITVTPAHVAAFEAATGEWDVLINVIVKEWEDSVWFPNPPAVDTHLYYKMVALARSCQQYGKFKASKRLLELAGAWAELMSLCVFQADFIGLSSVGKLAATKAEYDMSTLADQMAAVNEDAYRRSGAAGTGRANTDDWKVDIGTPAAVSGALDLSSGGSPIAPSSKKKKGDDNDDDNDEGKISLTAPLPRYYQQQQQQQQGRDVLGLDSGGAGLNRNENDHNGGDGDDIDVAPAGRLPFMEASLAVLSAEVPTTSPVLELAKQEVTVVTANAAAKEAREKAASTDKKSRKKKKSKKEEEEEKEKEKEKEKKEEDMEVEMAEEEGQPIPPLDLSTLEAYLGIPGATILHSSSGASAGGGVKPASLDHHQVEIGMMPAPPAPPRADAATVGGAGGQAATAAVTTTTAAVDSPSKEGGETAAQAAARAAFRHDSFDVDDFFSSDEEDTMMMLSGSGYPGGGAASGEGSIRGYRHTTGDGDEEDDDADTRSIASTSTMSQRFKLSIKSAEEASKSQSGMMDPSLLRSAAASLRLGSMSMGPSASSVRSMDVGSATKKNGGGMVDDDDPFAAFANLSRSESNVSSFSASLPPTSARSNAADGGSGKKDLFADFAGLPAAGASATSSATAAKPSPFQDVHHTTTPVATATITAPMRPQQAQPASDLLSGWDEFEAMFGGSTIATPAVSTREPITSAAQQQQQQQQHSVDIFNQLAAPSSSAPAPVVAVGSEVVAKEEKGKKKDSKSKEKKSKSGKKNQQQQTIIVDKGVDAFNSYHWENAARCFADSLAEGSTHGINVLAMYSVARLFVMANSRAGGNNSTDAARLARYAVALPLEPAIKDAAILAAADLNMAAGNYAYASNKLLELASSGSGGDWAEGKVQSMLDRCEQQAGNDISVPGDEDLESFAAIATTCSDRAEADELISNLAL